MDYQNKIKRHTLIVSLLASRDSSFEEIRTRLKLHNIHEENYTLRTFQRDIKLIESVFSIPIMFNSVNRRYEIKDKESHKKNIEVFHILSSNVHSSHYREFILSEPSEGLGSVHIKEIIHAIQNEYPLSIKYKKYTDTDALEREILPLGLKENNKRWYVLAEDIQLEKIRVFGLDRIDHLRVVFNRRKSRFANRETVRLWASSIGITMPSSTNQAVDVRIQFDEVMAPYVMTLPWHASQIIIEERDGEILVELHVLIDNYLINKILSCGNHAVVVSPSDLKSKIVSTLQSTLENYAR